MRRFRNPSYAPEGLERRLNPSGASIPVAAEIAQQNPAPVGSGYGTATKPTKFDPPPTPLDPLDPLNPSPGTGAPPSGGPPTPTGPSNPC